MIFRKNAVVLAAALLVNTTVSAFGQTISALSVYQQAINKDRYFFNLIKRYGNVVDVVDQRGDTAYCMAIRAKDGDTMSFLESYGANTKHACVSRAAQELEQNSGLKKTAASTRPAFKDSNVVGWNNKYLWWGIGALAVGGGVALLSSHGSGGDGASEAPWQRPDVWPDDVAKFRTEEYKTGNFLDDINASYAYNYIYTTDENGDLVSHQANSSEPLKTVRVGVIDTGVFANSDLSGKIVKTYDFNAYNDLGSVWGFQSESGVETYVFKVGDSYYGANIYTGGDGTETLEYWLDSKNGGRIAFSEAEVNSILEYLWGISLADMSLMNGGGGGNPGIDVSGLIVDPSVSGWYATWYQVAKELSHGTHVAGIIAGNKDDEGMHGVAFENAEIVAVSWDMKQNLEEPVKAMISDGVSVINNSWGAADTFDSFSANNAGLLYELDPDTLKAYAYAAQHGAVWVQATGNDGYHDATIYAGIPQLDLSGYGYKGSGKYEVPFLAVAALDASTATESAQSGQIASYSNWCGSTKGYCLAAPGTDVKSTAAMNEGAISMSGTSMATPVVSGSVALLMGYYPWLSAQNVAYLLLETADRSGDYSNSDIYGRGVLDLYAAVVTPVGELGLPVGTSTDSVVSVSGTRLSISGPLQKRLESLMPEEVVAFDELKRPFSYDTGNIVSKTHGSNADFRNKVSRAALGGVKRVVKDEKTGFQFSSSDYLNRGGMANLSSAEVVSESVNGSRRFYYAANSKYMNDENVLTSTSNPYFAMNEAYGAENVLNLSETSKLKLMLQTGENGLYERDYEQDRHSFDERSYAVGAEYSFKLADYLTLAAMGGMLYEEDAMLGLNGRGAFGVQDGSTYYMGLKAALNLTDKITIMAAYYRGYTGGSDAALLSISDLETESFTATAEYKLSGTDKVGVSLSSPMSVVKGRASLSYASGRDNYSDTVYMKKLSSSLKPAAKEYDLGLYYQGAPKEDLSLMGKVEARFNADGEKGCTDYLGIVGVSAAF